jgi:DNA-binding NtrC family response regulator
VLLGSGEQLDPEVIETGAAESEPPFITSPSPLAGRSVHDVEREHILRTLQHCFGNRTHAATILGISIRALRNKLNEYAAQGMDVPRPNAGIAA